MQELPALFKGSSKEKKLVWFAWSVLLKPSFFLCRFVQVPHGQWMIISELAKEATCRSLTDNQE